MALAQGHDLGDNMDKFIDKFKPFLINESDSKELYALQTKILNSHSEESLKIMQLALLQCEFPFENYERAIEILRLDAGESKDIRTGIIGFEMSFLFSDVDNAFRDNIKRLYAESSGYYQSLAEYLFALEYYLNKDYNSALTHLNKSIELCDKHVYNYELMSKLCRGSKKKAFLELARNNIQGPRYCTPGQTIPDPDDYIGEFVSGRMRPTETFDE